MRPLIYTPSGRAGEYANHGYAANLYRGCTHGCLYCYSPGALRMTREAFHSRVTPAPDVLERLKRDMMRVGQLPEPVFLCFSCDPYCAGEDTSITREAIKIILSHGNTVNILTKGGGIQATRDLDLLKGTASKVGATLTFFDGELSQTWEPNAALPWNRRYVLRVAKEMGIETWASIEPVIVPSESLRVMEVAMPFVDTFKIGKLNHHPLAKEIDWAKFLEDAVSLCDDYGKPYVIKQDLLKFKR